MSSLATLAADALPVCHLRPGLLGNLGRQIQMQCVFRLASDWWRVEPYTEECARQWGCVRFVSAGFTLLFNNRVQNWEPNIASLRGCVHTLEILLSNSYAVYKAIELLQPMQVKCHMHLERFEYPGYRTIHYDQWRPLQKTKKTTLYVFFDIRSTSRFITKLVHVASIRKMREMRKALKRRR